jgi:23S rRNA pseudouridine1911/1915/1917 synthase
MQSPKTISFSVKDSDTGLRIDKYLHSQIPKISRAFIQKLIDRELVLVNGRSVKTSFKISPGDTIQVTLPEAEVTDIIPENISLDILFEDDHLLVINKPAGLVVHPGAGIHSGTLVNALMFHCRDLSGVGGRLRPGIVHRLDKNTSGLLVVAKNDVAHLGLTQQLSQKEMKREYLALVWRVFENDQGTIDTFLGRSKKDRTKFVVSGSGRQALTNYKVLKNYRFLSYIKVILATGRTHQIRAHMNHIHHPVFGDPEYHGRGKQLCQLNTNEDRKLARHLLNIISRQALHAYKLEFIHPVSGQKMSFKQPVPEDIKNLLDILETYELK